MCSFFLSNLGKKTGAMNLEEWPLPDTASLSSFYILNLVGHSLLVELEEINNCGKKVKDVLVSKYSS